MSESSMRAVQVEQRITSSPLPNQRTHPLAYVLAGGLIAGTLDILYAYTFWTMKSQIPAQRIFQDVAAGLLGEASFQGGWSTAALGVALHFLIAIPSRWCITWSLSAGLSSGDTRCSPARSTACWCTE
jgi:ribose/xylose/arabinose/galactoside ABC-type transport system permease subunit